MPSKDETIYVSPDTVATGIDIEKVSFYDDPNGQPLVGFVLTDDGSQRFWNATSTNVGKKLAILLDGRVVSAPNILQGIKKQGVITGDFNDDDLMRFFTAIVLRKMLATEAPEEGG
ncbi:SecDF P1 head subdomain-containing protein [Aporhodopirellula aestuarii]|uniref:SecDF P1 head subdomain domain-containing protein n=1 Tax=Aporhodopirellula aestuarii TaxID=2950107 RepID=A0ABT0UBJ6_9BACT|nr:hypothetical protein [Aporhodopirellula aestuarii]MCM2374382.1 hypothetical protein [Aporhodopirellula aestuarii]